MVVSSYTMAYQSGTPRSVCVSMGHGTRSVVVGTLLLIVILLELLALKLATLLTVRQSLICTQCSEFIPIYMLSFVVLKFIFLVFFSRRNECCGAVES